MPHAQILSALEGHPGGRIIIATLGDDPAAGDEVSVTIPGRAHWLLHSLVTRLTNDATVADRHVLLTFDDGINVFFRSQTNRNVGANNSEEYCWSDGVQQTANFSDFVMAPLPRAMPLVPGWRIRTQTINLQSGDNFTAPMLYLTEIPERSQAVWDALARAEIREIIERRALNV